MMLTNKKHPPHRPHPQVQQGITLIELMIALVIGLLATGAMLKVYVDSKMGASQRNSSAAMHGWRGSGAVITKQAWAT